MRQHFESSALSCCDKTTIKRTKKNQSVVKLYFIFWCRKYKFTIHFGFLFLFLGSQQIHSSQTIFKFWKIIFLFVLVLVTVTSFSCWSNHSLRSKTCSVLRKFRQSYLAKQVLSSNFKLIGVTFPMIFLFFFLHTLI